VYKEPRDTAWIRTKDPQLSLPLRFHAIFRCLIVWTIPLPYLLQDLGNRRLVSTPSSFEAWLGISILKLSPNLTIYMFKISQEPLQLLNLKADALSG